MKSCPSRDALERLLADELPGPDFAAIQEHVDHCGSCQQFLDTLTGPSLRPPPPLASPECRGANDPALSPRQDFLDQLAAHGPSGDAPASELEDATSRGTPDIAWPIIPGYEILRVLGRGGMGTVYDARQLSLNRRVALKVLFAGGLTPKGVQRFRCEAETAAKLHHTNIVPVYAIGEEYGVHFYAMELIDGPSLDHLIRAMRARRDIEAAGAATSGCESGLPLELRRTGPYVEGGPSAVAGPGLDSSSLGSGSAYFDTVARMIAEVADALEYAHQQGVVHRDVKPANLLLSPAGRLSLTDFGLARVLEQPGMTLSGEFVGTPAYMSPEQIAVGRIALDHRTDIYSLGATLYELLTLEPPHRASSREQVLAAIVQKEPKAPRRVQRKVPVDLDTICLKCLEKDPDRRYQTAGELADDLRRYVNRFAILARRPGPAQRLAKWVRRRPAMAASLGCLFMAVFVAFVFAHRAYRADELRRIEHEKDRLQLLDEKIRNAYLVASSGNLKKTDDAIREIEDLGASTGQVRLLRGVVAYFRQDIETAVTELEQAVKLLPQSVAARALLAMSYADAGQDEERIIREMARLSPSSPEDYLFKGYAREINELGGQGLADLDEGIKQRDFPLGRALRTFARANRAIDSGRLQDAKAALDDANAARGMLPDNPLALYVSLYARVVAAGIYREAKLSQERTAVLQDAARDAQSLEEFIELPNSAFVLWLYYEEMGDTGKALEVAKRSFDRTGLQLAAFYYLVSLYEKGKFAEALGLLNRRRRPDWTGEVMRVFLLAELPDGPRRALEQYHKLDTQEGWRMWTKSEILLFLGKKEQALRSLRAVRSPVALSQEWTEFYEAMRRFDRGEISEDAYLARAGTSRWKQFHVHYQIGLLRLAEGDRSAARDRFQKAVDTRAIWIYPWAWSKMFLGRLQNDPKWPPWIPMKENPPKPP
jgi:serine/threonine protein kinase